MVAYTSRRRKSTLKVFIVNGRNIR